MVNYFNYIVDRQKLDENQSSYFFYQLINRLDYIHHKNIVHRDLKPENLLLGKGNIKNSRFWVKQLC